MKAREMREIVRAGGVTGLAEKVDLAEEFKEASDRLGMMGLSPYEAMTYIALVAHGYGDAETIAATAGIPRTSAYKVLQSLQQKGFANSTAGRPVIYKPEPPSKMRELTESKIRETFEKLELLHEIVAERGEPQLIYTITGREKVLSKIGELLDKSSASFVISTPVFSEIRDALGKKFTNALQRGVEIEVITAPFQRVKEDVRVIRNENLLATDVISDQQRALLASLDLSACGFTDNPELSRHLQRFLDILVDASQAPAPSRVRRTPAPEAARPQPK
ncbi:MAG: TrmB family transcriptional regulator [Euryarchaeota archaeon]|nr:TrmB family transcriptional regulator [Euryarchaeota archaeon]